MLRFCGVTVERAYATRAPSGAALRRAVASAGGTPPPPPQPVLPVLCPCCWDALARVDAPAGHGDVLRVSGVAPGEGAARGELVHASLAAASAALLARGHHTAAESVLHAVTLPPGLALAGCAQAAALGRAREAVTPLRAALLAALAPAAAAGGPPAPQQHSLPSLHLCLLFSAPEASAALLAAAGLAPPPPQPLRKRRWYARDAPAADEGAPSAATVVTAAQEAFNGASKRAAAMPPADLAAALPVPFSPPAGAALCVAFSAARPAFELGGYYTKSLRGLSQSPWLADDGPVGSGSVSGELEAALQSVLLCDELRFIAAGREDMDVRMLGGGRPFLFVAVNCRCGPQALSPQSLAALAAAVGAAGRLGVRALAALGPEHRGALREGEAEKAKCYRAVVWLSRPLRARAAVLARLAALVDVQLEQRTPLRVLHRRAPLTRERAVHSLAATPLPGGAGLLLDLRCAAGTYVKEFVHGDWGRTRPCLGTLLRAAEVAQGVPEEPLQCDCVQLDVRAVEMEWL